jgi:hypothetical protein
MAPSIETPAGRFSGDSVSASAWSPAADRLEPGAGPATDGNRAGSGAGSLGGAGRTASGRGGSTLSSGPLGGGSRAAGRGSSSRAGGAGLVVASTSRGGAIELGAGGDGGLAGGFNRGVTVGGGGVAVSGAISSAWIRASIRGAVRTPMASTPATRARWIAPDAAKGIPRKSFLPSSIVLEGPLTPSNLPVCDTGPPRRAWYHPVAPRER